MKVSLDAIARLAEFSGAPAGAELASPGLDVAVIGESREGRPIHAVRAGGGRRHVSLVAGAHADEPVGPATLAALCRWLATGDGREILDHARFSICPHLNPDGAHRNLPWTSRDEWRLEDCLEHAVREAPGDDVEFGFPATAEDEVRPENRAAADFLAEEGPYDYHASLHGMAIAEGAWFLIDRANVGGTAELRRDLAALARRLGVPLHDWDRDGEKGFHRIEPGFSTTPTSAAMRSHFERLGQPEVAARFRWSSMELVASLGGSPLAMVSEVPLFLVRPSPPDAPRPGHRFLEARDALLAARMDGAASGSFDELRRRFGLDPFPRLTAVKLQLAMVLLGSGLARPQEID